MNRALLEAAGKVYAKAGRPGRFESWVKLQFESAGFKVLDKGWPDFLIVSPNGDVEAWEIKQGCDTVKPHQAEMHKFLRKVGLKTWVVRDDRETNPWKVFMENFDELMAEGQKRRARADFEGLGVS